MKKLLLYASISIAQLSIAQSSTMQQITLPGIGRIQNANLFNGKLYFSQETDNGQYVDAVWDGTTITSFGISLQRVTTLAGFSGNFFNNTTTGIQYFKRDNSIYSFNGTNMNPVANQPASIIYGSTLYDEAYKMGINRAATDCIISGTVAGFLKLYKFNGTTFVDVTPTNDIIGVDVNSSFYSFQKFQTNEDRKIIVKRANAGNPKFALVSFKASGTTISDFDLADFKHNSITPGVYGLGVYNNKSYFSYTSTILSNFSSISKIGSYNISTGVMQSESQFDNFNIGLNSYLETESIVFYSNPTLSISGINGFFNGSTIIGIGEKMPSKTRASFIGKTNGKNYILGKSTLGTNYDIYEYNNGICTLVTIAGGKPNVNLGFGSSFEDMTTEAQGARELYAGVLPLYSDDNNQLIFHFFDGSSFDNVTINGYRAVDNGSKIDKGRMFLEARTNGSNSMSQFLFMNGKKPEFLHPNDITTRSFDEDDVYTANSNNYLIGIETTTTSSIVPNKYIYYILTPYSNTPTTTTSSITGLSNTISENYEVHIFPNPSENGVFNLNFSANYEILNAQGMIVVSGESNLINISNLRRGLYFVRIKTNKGYVTKKIVY